MSGIGTKDNRKEKRVPQKRQSRLTWRWVLLAFILVAIISTSAIVLREHLKDFAGFGYLGAFATCFLGSATAIFGVPSLWLVLLLAAALNPFYLGLAAGAGEAIGELIIYTAGRTGHAFFLKGRLDEARSSEQARGIYPRLEKWIHAKGALALFLASAIPNPFFSLISATAGATRFPLWKFLAVVWAGKTTKWITIALLVYLTLGRIVSAVTDWFHT